MKIRFLFFLAIVLCCFSFQLWTSKTTETLVQSRRGLFVAATITFSGCLVQFERLVESLDRNWPANPITLTVSVVVNLDDSKNQTVMAQIWQTSQLIGGKVKTINENSYTKAVNSGIDLTAHFNIIINCDVVVQHRWVEKLLAGFTFPNVGIVGPLSNAASVQSIPDARSANGRWAVNKLPFGFSARSFDYYLEQHAKSSHLPIHNVGNLTILNGFLLMFKTDVFKKVGLFDEKHFPVGYGEEVALQIEAHKAGFQTVVCLNSYVWHDKTSSPHFQQKQAQLKQTANKYLKSQFSAELGLEEKRQLQFRTGLTPVARAITQHNNIFLNRSKNTIVYLMWDLNDTSGGVLSVLLLVEAMYKSGVDVTILVPEGRCFGLSKTKPYILTYKRPYDPRLAKMSRDFADKVARFDVVVATFWPTVFQVASLKLRPSQKVFYFCQDYEPWFYKENHPDFALAAESYKKLPFDGYLVKTHWLADVLRRKQQVTPTLVPIGFSESLVARQCLKRHSRAIIITAMIRVTTPRRAARKTIEVLKILQKSLHFPIKIKLFGSAKEDIDALVWDEKLQPTVNFGFLTQKAVSKLLACSDYFLDVSKFQAMGRVALTAMANGCIPIVPQNGGSSTYLGKLGHYIDTASSAQEIAKNITTQLNSVSKGSIAKQKAKCRSRARQFTVEAAAAGHAKALLSK